MCGTAGFTFDKMLHSMSDETYDIIMKVHVRAPFRLVRTAAPYFRIKVMCKPTRLVGLMLTPIIEWRTREQDCNNDFVHRRPPR